MTLFGRLLLSGLGPGALLLTAGCGGAEFVNTATLPDNYLCSQMKDVCKEAREFENAYAKMSAEEKKDAENVLKAYRMQCADALDQCRKSAEKK
jgi:hypothetical protein